MILLITDGEPHDVDTHDPKYLLEDAKRAVHEATRMGLFVYCVTMDPGADRYSQHIFGAGNYRVLDRIESLPELLPRIYLRMTR